MSKYFRTSVLSLISICVLTVFNVGCEEEKPGEETPPVVATPCTGKVIFTTAVSNGNFGGASGADVICNNNKPSGLSGSNFKALLTDNSRRACYNSGNDNCGIIGVTGRLDWVLPASSNLCTTDAKLVGTTDANKFIDYIYPGVFSATSTVTYTGFNVSWGQSATNCTQFAATGGTGTAGSGHVGMNGFISSTIPSCTTAGTIYCVEQ